MGWFRDGRKQSSAGGTQENCRNSKPRLARPGEAVGRVQKTGRRVDLVVGVAEAELFEDSLGDGIVRMMAGKKMVETQRAEGVRDDRLRGFGSQPFSPKLRTEMVAQLEDLFFEIIRMQAAAAHEFVVGEKEDGPVLKVVRGLKGDFTGQALMDLGFGERAAKGLADFEIAPEGSRKSKVSGRPGSETEAGGF